MPQLDLGTLTLQTNLTYYFFLIFYGLILKFYLPNIAAAMKARSYILKELYISNTEFLGYIAYSQRFLGWAYIALINALIDSIEQYIIFISSSASEEIKTLQDFFFIPAYIYTLKKIKYLNNL